MHVFECRIILQQIKLSSRAIAIIGLLMSISGCVLMGDWQAIPFDKCTYFSPYHNPALYSDKTMERLLHGDTQLRIQKISDNAGDFMSTLGDEIKCSITTSERIDCNKMQNDCLLIQYSSGIEFNIFHYPCEAIQNVKTYAACQWSWNQTFCLYVNETSDQAKTESFAASTHLIMTQDNDYTMKWCTQADVESNSCHWTPNSTIANHYCSDCPPICRSVSKSLNFAQFCIGAALLMLAIPIAWVPIAAMASERTSKDMQVHIITSYSKFST